MTLYVLPPLAGVLWSVGFIADDTLARCGLRLRTLLYLLTRGDVAAFLFLVTWVFLFVSFFLLWWWAENTL